MQKFLCFKGRFACRRADLPALIVRAMRITILLTVVAVMNVCAKGYSQDPHLTLSLNEVKLSQVFAIIQQRTDYQFLYNDEDVAGAPPVSISVKNATVAQVLAICFKDYPLSYHIENKTVVVLPRTVMQLKPPLPPATTPSSFTVKGRVLNEDGDPVPGVTVTVKGTGKGTVTDATGCYSINIEEVSSTLVFSFIGYGRQEVGVDGRAAINVTLVKTVSPLDEVVTVGYGVQKKVDLTGAITQLDGTTIANRPVSNLEQALQGMVPGLNITPTATSGQPGEG
jgi:hypothetical protein